MQKDQLVEALCAALSPEVIRVYGEGARLDSLVRLSGGASRETWAFDVILETGERLPLILKRDPMAYRSGGLPGSEEPALGVSRWELEDVSALPRCIFQMQ